MKLLFSFTGLFLLFSNPSLGQGTNIPLGSYNYHILDRQEILSGQNIPDFHTALQPYNRYQITDYYNSFFTDDEVETDYIVEAEEAARKINIGSYNSEYIIYDNLEWTIFRDQIKSQQTFLKYFYQTPATLYEVNEDDFIVKVNPVLNLQLGNSNNENETKYINTRGIEIRGVIDNQIGFYTLLTENQAFQPNYIQDFILEEQAVPGQGFYKEFKTTGIDYFNAQGHVDFSPTRHINLQFGHGKHFIGNGFRSLLLSDFSNNYLFLKFSTKIWKFNYQNLFTQFKTQYSRGADTLLQNKYGAFHHLSLNVTKWLNIGLFEGIIFSRNQGYDVNYLNPIIFYRSVEQNLGSPDNASIGLTYKIIFLKHFSWYGQLMIDEFNLSQFRESTSWWGNKYGIQTGLKYVDMFGIPYLDGQVEYNQVRPYMYTHKDEKANYTHYNQPLAHPLGANFSEVVALLSFQATKRLMLSTKTISYLKGIDDDSTNWGGDIFKSYLTREKDDGNITGQGVSNQILLNEFMVSYQLKHNLFLELSYLIRESSQSNVAATNYLSFSLRWNAGRRAFDF